MPSQKLNAKRRLRSATARILRDLFVLQTDHPIRIYTGDQ